MFNKRFSTKYTDNWYLGFSTKYTDNWCLGNIMLRKNSWKKEFSKVMSVLNNKMYKNLKFTQHNKRVI